MKPHVAFPVKSGYIKSTRLPSHPVMGFSTIPQIIIRESADWTDSLPVPKPQSEPTFESYNCSGYGTTNAAATLVKGSFGISCDYCPRALGIAAGTKWGTGNDPWKVAETFQSLGAINDSVLPLEPSETPQAYYSPSPLPASITELGKEWLAQYTFYPEWVFQPGASLATTQSSMTQALKYSPLGASVYAWVQDENGLYYSPEGTDNNHWVEIFSAVPGQYWLALDSYADETGSYIKKLRWDFVFEDSIRYHIEQVKKDTVVQKGNGFVQLVENIAEFIINTVGCGR